MVLAAKVRSDARQFHVNLENEAVQKETTHMANTPANRDSAGSSGVDPDRDSPPRTPRWVKVFGIIALVIVLLFLILMLTRGPSGGHGPGRHFSSSDDRSQTTPPGVVEGHTAPSAGRG